MESFPIFVYDVKDKFSFTQELLLSKNFDFFRIEMLYISNNNCCHNINISTIVNILITLCMKLSWFCQTNSGQLFCNCPLFVIALVPGFIFGRKPDETCCHSVVASKWLKTRVSHAVCSVGRKYYNLNTDRDY